MHVALEVLVPAIVIRAEFGHDGDPGLWEGVHWTYPVGAAVVLFGGTTVAAKVRVSP